MKTVLHKSASRGHANYGWLDTRYTFSFAGYYNPERIHFGALRVLNDDLIESGYGFDLHPHDNMEVISIPLDGELEHKDSMGHKSVIRPGEIQVMSAGTGIFHSEHNRGKEGLSNFLQIWVFPNKRNVEPRYENINIAALVEPNRIAQIVSPDKEDQGSWINQDAWFYLADVDKGWQESYTLKGSDSGVYIFMIEGAAEVNGHPIEKRDGLGVWETAEVSFKATEKSRLLIMEVPMHV